MAVDPNPTLTVFPKAPPPNQPHSINTPIGTPGPSPDNQTALTPAATPSSSEPNFDFQNDPDAHLIDIGDDTWGLILAHRTNVSGSMLEYRPSLSTGYLLRRNLGEGTPLDPDEDKGAVGYGLAAVHLLWIGSSPRQPPNNAQSQNQNLNSNQHPPSSSPTDPTAGPPTVPAGNGGNGGALPKATADSILRDYLGIYRGLGTLARARGLKGAKRGLLPWHVVVAKRGVEGLENVYGGIL
jgi:mediator of RNA polymerase II transcription subunit 13